SIPTILLGRQVVSRQPSTCNSQPCRVQSTQGCGRSQEGRISHREPSTFNPQTLNPQPCNLQPVTCNPFASCNQFVVYLLFACIAAPMTQSRQETKNRGERVYPGRRRAVCLQPHYS